MTQWRSHFIDITSDAKSRVASNMMQRMLRSGVVAVVLIASACAGPDGQPSTRALSTVSTGLTVDATGRPSTTLEATTFALPTTTPVTTAQVVSAPTAPASIVLGIDIGGRHRSSIVHLPSLTPGVVVPLLMALHGAGSDAARFEAKTGFDQIADGDHFIVVYPEATLIGSVGTARTWNAGRCCSPASSTGVDDEEYLVALLDRLELAYPIDARRVYVVGHSNGGMLAQRLGCEQAARVAAVASVAGSLALSSCAPALPVAMVEIHGTADHQVAMSAAVSGVDVWRDADRCQSAVDVATAGAVTTTTWHCAQGSDVRIVQIAGAQHPWPGGRTPSPAGQVASAALDASEVAWTFVSSYTRT